MTTAKRHRSVTAIEPTDAVLGPAMAALTDKQQAFVRALFEAPKTHGAGTFAAKMAGYSSSSRSVLASIAYQLNGDPRVQLAIAEVSQQYLTTLGPLAVRALKKVLGQPSHRDFGRAIGIVMDRVAPQNSTHIVKVQHDATPALRATADVIARIEVLARAAGLDVAKMPPLIDVTPMKESAA